VREIAPGQFELRASKRGRRAGLVDTEDKPATEIFLQHGNTGICWERAHAPEDERTAEEDADAQEIISVMEAGRAYDRTEIRTLVEKVMGVSKSAVNKPGRRTHRVYMRVLEKTRSKHVPNVFHRIALSGDTGTSGDKDACPSVGTR
jgi:hypothetical protein